MKFSHQKTESQIRYHTNSERIPGQRDAYGKAPNLPLAKSRPVRVWLERDGEPVAYEVSLSASCSDLFLDHVDLREQAKQDGLSLPAIRTRLRGWLRREPDVEKVAVTYGADRYTVAILASPLTRTIMTCLHASFERVLDVFGDCHPHVYVVGSKQREAAMLHSLMCTVTRADDLGN